MKRDWNEKERDSTRKRKIERELPEIAGIVEIAGKSPGKSPEKSRLKDRDREKLTHEWVLVFLSPN